MREALSESGKGEEEREKWLAIEKRSERTNSSPAGGGRGERRERSVGSVRVVVSAISFVSCNNIFCKPSFARQYVSINGLNERIPSFSNAK